MCHLFESIRVYNGQVRNLRYHQERIQRAFDSKGKKCHLNLIEIRQKLDIPETGLHKLRISYAIENGLKVVTINPYKSKSITSLKLTELTSETYTHKFEDRKFINQYVADKNIFDDVLFYRNEKILDSSYCNIAFYDGKDWLTPKVPLLQGTMRAKLIDQEKIKPKDIYLKDLQNFKKARLFNAMILWSDEMDMTIKHITK